MIDFTSKWDEIRPKQPRAETIRVAPEHPLDLFVGFSETGNRIFVLQNDEKFFDLVTLPSFENIYVYADSSTSKNNLILELESIELRDLFSSICLDLVCASSKSATPKGAATVFLNRLVRWAELLKEGRNGGLTDSEQLGLLGELSFLSWLLEENVLDSNTLVRGWRGPDGDARDISVGMLSAEIKAKRNTSKNVLNISSLDQLDITEREVVIVLYRFSPSDQGVSLESLSGKLLSELQTNPMVAWNFLRKLYLTGYDSNAEYAHNLYELKESVNYLVDEGFPKLGRSNVHTAILKASYEIDCNQITEYKVNNATLLRMING